MSQPPWPLWEVLVVLILSVLISALPLRLMGQGRPLGLSLISFLLQSAGFFLLPLYDVCLRRRLPGTSLGFGPHQWGACLRIGLPAGVILYTLNILASLLVNAILPERLIKTQEVLTMLYMSKGFMELLLTALLICLIGPLAEEMLFRAFLWPPLRAMVGRKWGLLLSGLLFAGIHFNLAAFLPLLVGGIGFAWLYDRYGSIYINTIAHVVWNSVAFILFLLVR